MSRRCCILKFCSFWMNKSTQPFPPYFAKTIDSFSHISILFFVLSKSHHRENHNFHKYKIAKNYLYTISRKNVNENQPAAILPLFFNLHSRIFSIICFFTTFKHLYFYLINYCYLFIFSSLKHLHSI